MNADELMAKSISRITTEVSENSRTWKTARRIMDGSKWDRFTAEDRKTIQMAFDKYEQTIADHLFIKDGLGDISVSDIRNAVEKHITVTGRRPVAVVDYIQILKPHDIRASDKANLDYSVLELKRISRDNGIPILAISSFNRENAGTDANVTAFSGSGALEYTADVAMAIQVEKQGEAGKGAKGDKMSKAENMSYVDKETQKDIRTVELAVLKNRFGKKKRFLFEYDCVFSKFNEVQRHKYPPEDEKCGPGDIPVIK